MAKKPTLSKTKVAKTDEIILAGKPVGKAKQTNVSGLIARAIGALNSEQISFSDRIDAHLSWEVEGAPLNSRELADYLLSFTRMYSAASQIREKDALYGTRSGGKLLERGLPRPRPMDSFNILRISYASPLEIVIGGIAVGIAVAVVLSGGQFEITTRGIKAKLPPIGTGIAAILRALAMLPRRKRFYGDAIFDDSLQFDTTKKLKPKQATPSSPLALKGVKRAPKRTSSRKSKK